jgi:exosortase/archaeosortase family protein
MINRSFNPATALLITGAALLAYAPMRWLVATWYAPGYEHTGALVFLVCVGLFVWSWRSPIESRTPPGGVVYLLGLTAGLRLAAQLLDVNVLGALLLAVDVFALAQLAGLPDRKRAVSPFWLAVLFCGALPIEPMLQRLLGYGLQHTSAWLACGMLQPWFADLTCDGIRLTAQGQDVLVDLPCSGAELLAVMGLVFAAINALRRPALRTVCWAVPAGLVICLLGNALRISILALGIVYRDAWSIDVMAPLPHTLIGLVTVSLASVAIWMMASLYRSSILLEAPRPGTNDSNESAAPRVAMASLFLCFAAAVGGLQPRPVDASTSLTPPGAPLVAADFVGVQLPLSGAEENYFLRYGGGAQRMAFGPFGLLLVSTASPLRHLHDPTICLTGMGYTVQLEGTNHREGSTVYTAYSDVDETRYDIYVAYFSDTGELATSVSEVVWHWLKRPGSRWTMVQQIVPRGIDSDSVIAWRASVHRAFNLMGVS